MTGCQGSGYRRICLAQRINDLSDYARKASRSPHRYDEDEVYRLKGAIAEAREVLAQHEAECPTCQSAGAA
jgi:hypothetical protein